jgi:hypothetical protein
LTNLSNDDVACTGKYSVLSQDVCQCLQTCQLLLVSTRSTINRQTTELLWYVGVLDQSSERIVIGHRHCTAIRVDRSSLTYQFSIVHCVWMFDSIEEQNEKQMISPRGVRANQPRSMAKRTDQTAMSIPFDL